MSDEYTPTTGEVRALYVAATPSHRVSVVDGNAEFDRWIRAHDAEVAAKTLEDAAGDLRAGCGPIDMRRTDEWLESRAGRLRYPS